MTTCKENPSQCVPIGGHRCILSWDVYWAPEGRQIATVKAKDARSAIRKAPYPYRRYLGEMYAYEVGTHTKGEADNG